MTRIVADKNHISGPSTFNVIAIILLCNPVTTIESKKNYHSLIHLSEGCACILKFNLFTSLQSTVNAAGGFTHAGDNNKVNN